MSEEEKVQSQTQDKSLGKEYEQIKELAEKYEAFMRLQKVDVSLETDFIRKQVELIEKGEELEKLSDKHNALIGDVNKWSKRYERRVDSFNDAKYTAGADSLSEKLHRKYIDSAVKKGKAASEDVMSTRQDIQKAYDEYLEMEERQKAFEDEVFRKNEEYATRGLSVARQMCENFPANPLVYLYVANWYKRHVKQCEELLEYVYDVYGEDSPNAKFAEERYCIPEFQKNYEEELGKFEEFATPQIKTQYATLIKNLKNGKSGKATASKSAANKSTATASKSTTSKTTTTKAPAKSTTATTKKSTSTKKIAAADAKKKKNRKHMYAREQRKIKAQHVATQAVISLVSWVLVLGVLGAIAACVLKFVFHLF